MIFVYLHFMKQVFLWYGDNDYEIFQTRQQWINRFSQKHTNLNILKFDLADKNKDQQFLVNLKNAFQTNTLFANEKLIIFKNFLDKANAQAEDLLFKFLEKPVEGFFLIFIEQGKPDARKKLYKALQKNEKNNLAEIKEYVLPKEIELNKWAKQKIEKAGNTINNKALENLIALVGSDMWQLDNEIRKLTSYKIKTEITNEDINLLVKAKFNDNIFQLTDAISARDKKKILKLFQDQLDSGASELYLLAMLTRQFRILLQLKDLQQQNYSPKEMQAKIKMHPFVIKKTCTYLQNFSMEQLKSIYEKLFEFEVKLKTKNIKLELLFDLLVAKL